jgi:biopolymer transport protein ExbD
MADKPQYQDVWLVETNTVYREVPYTVVCDWVQQGRVLEDDQLRPSGTRDWKRVGDLPAFAAYLPKPEPLRAEDAAEALEPVELEIGWRHRKPGELEDDEVDMIPLIDVSLVLLIFFMMTASGVGAASLVKLAEVKSPPVSDTSGLVLNVALGGEKPNRYVIYSIGEDGKASPEADDRDIRKREVMLARFNSRLEKKTGKVEVTINPDGDLPDGDLVDLILKVKELPSAAKVGRIYNGVAGKKP